MFVIFGFPGSAKRLDTPLTAKEAAELEAHKIAEGLDEPTVPWKKGRSSSQKQPVPAASHGPSLSPLAESA